MNNVVKNDAMNLVLKVNAKANSQLIASVYALGCRYMFCSVCLFIKLTKWFIKCLCILFHASV